MYGEDETDPSLVSDTMQPARPSMRPPGSFAPMTANSETSTASTADLRARPKRLASTAGPDEALTVAKARSQQQGGSAAAGTAIHASFTLHADESQTSRQNFSRPTLSTAVSAARSVASTRPHQEHPWGGSSPLAQPLTFSAASTSPGKSGHARKQSQNAGVFEPTLPSTSTSGLSAHIGMAQSSPPLRPEAHRKYSASQIAAQAAVLQHQNQQQQHTRQRSQTLPVPGADHDAPLPALAKRGSGGPLSPPMLSLTEASAPRESGFGDQSYRNGLLGSHSAAATTAANVVFPRSAQSSPCMATQAQVPERKAEKPKVKLYFSRPGKIGTKGDAKDKAQPSPGKMLSSLQRGNLSTTSLESTAQTFFSLQNSSTATIRPVDSSIRPVDSSSTGEAEIKERKHHFLSRQKHKLKDEFHLPLSSAKSNSKPSDPLAPSSLYNFHLPSSPGPNSTGFKNSLDLRHGVRGREKRRDKDAMPPDDAASSYGEWLGPSSLQPANGSTMYLNEPFDSNKYGLNNMAYDDAWPFLKAKLLVVFEGEDVRIPVEDVNRIVHMHLQYCINRRSPNTIVDDLRDLLATGFTSLDHTLRKTPEDRLIPALVELWIFAFTTVLPYMQAVFLPLDLEFMGAGAMMSPDQARDFWGAVQATPHRASPMDRNVAPREVRHMVLLSFRDMVILPRYDMLKAIFSCLSLDFLPQSLASPALASPPPMPNLGHQIAHAALQPHSLSAEPAESSTSFAAAFPGQGGPVPRPGTAMSLDPSVASYNSTGTTLLSDGVSAGAVSDGRSRAISNVSFGSDNNNAGGMPRTLSFPHALAGSSVVGSSGGGSAAGGGSSSREQNVESSKQVTDMVGRMLQCMSVLASVGYVPATVASAGGEGGGGLVDDEPTRMMEELNKLLKLNWLGRGRTGRNRRGLVGGRVRKGTATTISEAVESMA